jgi:hypothetical protein
MHALPSCHPNRKRLRIAPCDQLALITSLFDGIPLDTINCIASVVCSTAETSGDIRLTPKVAIAQLRLVCRSFCGIKHSHASLADFKIIEKTGSFLLVVTSHQLPDLQTAQSRRVDSHAISVDISSAIGGIYTKTIKQVCFDINDILDKDGFCQLRMTHDSNMSRLGLVNMGFDSSFDVTFDANTSHVLGFSEARSIQSNFLYPEDVWQSVTRPTPSCFQSLYIINPVAVETLIDGVDVPHLVRRLLFDVGYSYTTEIEEDWGGHTLPADWDNKNPLELLRGHLETSGEKMPFSCISDMLNACDSVKFAQIADSGYLEDDENCGLKFFDAPLPLSLPSILDYMPYYIPCESGDPCTLNVCAVSIASIGWKALHFGLTIPSDVFDAMAASSEHKDLLNLTCADFKNIKASCASQKIVFLRILEYQNGRDIGLARSWQVYWFPSATTVDDIANLLGVMGGTHREITLRVLIRKLLLLDNNTDVAGSVE